MTEQSPSRLSAGEPARRPRQGLPQRSAGGAGDAEASVERVVRSLEDDIIFARLKPGDRLVEDAVMARHAAKRHVVRQAFGALEALGIVAREPNKGASVRAFTRKEVADIYEVRALLQGHAAGLVPLPGDPALLDALRGIHAAHSAAVEAADLRAVYEHNNAFHDTLFAACGNAHLVEAIARYAGLAHAIRSYRIGDPALLDQARAEHAAMIEALARGDRERFVALCVEHIEPSRRAYLAAGDKG